MTQYLLLLIQYLKPIVILDSDAIWNTLRKKVCVGHIEKLVPLFNFLRDYIETVTESTHNTLDIRLTEKLCWYLTKVYLKQNI